MDIRQSIAGYCRRIRSSLAAFGDCERGNFLIYFAIALIPMVAAAGLGVDFARGYLARERLQAAIDASAIAMGSARGSDADIEALGQSFFFANYPDDFWAVPATPDITITRTNPADPTSRPETFEITATAELNTFFMRIMGEEFETLTIASGSEALAEVEGLELVLVLDITGSMWSTVNGVRKIDAMRDAARTLLDILFADDPAPELLRVAMVPYNTMVNIGSANAGVVRDTDSALFGETSWMGCVQARDGGHDITDAYTPGATDGTGEWPAYRWPVMPNLRNNGNKDADYCRNRADSSGDYDNYDDPNLYLAYESSSDGPNRGCGEPVMELTNNRSALESYLTDLSAVQSGGTMTVTGMVWGWRMISPDPPFTARAYDDADWQKAIIVLTDGQQVNPRINTGGGQCTQATHIDTPGGPVPWAFDPASRGIPGSAVSGGTKRGWSAYGFADPDDSAPLPGNNIKTALEQRFADVCDNIKAVADPNEPSQPAIDIFAITFGDGITQGDTISTLMSNCTTGSGNYFHAPDGTTLESAFEEIARQLTSLRLTR